jgi:hypothetical protein
MATNYDIPESIRRAGVVTTVQVVEQQPKPVVAGKTHCVIDANKFSYTWRANC